jgi:hypothetical protein
MAERQGYHLRKSRRRDPQALDYQAYELVTQRGGQVVGTYQGPVELHSLEARLKGLSAFIHELAGMNYFHAPVPQILEATQNFAALVGEDLAQQELAAINQARQQFGKEPALPPQI